ncbi:MAG: hypothetical protein KDK39_11940 [Leptospiraceae bacterium]|nr:hypothetical protein [Leptospiraceae bacterium]
MSKTVQAGIMVLGISLYSMPAAAQTKVQYMSRAWDLKTGKLAYIEKHTEFWAAKEHRRSQIRYTWPDDRVFAVKNVNYTKGKSDPDFSLTDYRTGYQESAVKQGQSYTVSLREGKSQPVKTAKVTAASNMVVDAGFDYFIRQNFNALEQGRTLSLNFVAPARQDAFAFRIFKTGTGQVNQRPVLKLRLQLANQVLRLLAEDIDVWYYTDTRQLYLYQGISNINNADGKSYKVRIVFSYN